MPVQLKERKQKLEEVSTESNALKVSKTGPSVEIASKDLKSGTQV